jgi:hypothetical protein
MLHRTVFTQNQLQASLLPHAARVRWKYDFMSDTGEFHHIELQTQDRWRLGGGSLAADWRPGDVALT